MRNARAALYWSTCALAVTLALGGQLGGCRADALQAGAASRSGEPAWKQAVAGRPIALPADHASHPEYKLEWWYYTGNLDGGDSGRYGFQVTFFRVGVDPSPSNRSRWAIRDLIMTHVAVTDGRGQRYLYAERLNRPGLGWAGAETERYRVWNEDWEAFLQGSTHRLKASAVSSNGGRPHPFRLDLALEETQPPALHGEDGYSRKGSDPGNASHYYSLPRMPTRGSLTIDGRTVAVTGLSWMDHEFGTSFLEPGQVGWDWFALQLADGRSLMLYRFRRSDGSEDPRSSGTLIDANGHATHLSFKDVSLTPGRTWTSPTSAAVYPVSWRIALPREKMELTVDAVLNPQELRTAESTGVTYWEGAVDVQGTGAGRPIAGRGYLEMTGYTGEAMGNYLR
jgi:predicted secreted hydrolase